MKKITSLSLFLAFSTVAPASVQLSPKVLDSISTPNEGEPLIGTLEFKDGAG